MTVFVRKNLLICSVTFAAADGSTTQPLNAELVVNYTNMAGVQETDTVPMSNTAGTWTASWDTSFCSGGRVDWMVHCWNGLVAADQGSIEVVANGANTV